MTATRDNSLTDRQRAIHDWLVDYWLGHGYPPTIREICAAFGIASPEGVMCHMRALRDKGYVTWSDGEARTVLPQTCKELLEELARRMKRGAT